MIKLLALSFVILVIFLDAPTVEGDLDFTVLHATKQSYKKFITDLRSALPIQEEVYDLPVLRPSISDSERFILVRLTNYNSETITVAIDVLNVYVVAYRVGDVSYLLNETSLSTAFKQLFKGTTHVPLQYSGSYSDLEYAAKKMRDKVEVGLPALDVAISNMFKPSNTDTTLVPKAFLKVIQTVSEAARYQYIEQEIANKVNTQFLPNLAFLALENKWSALSKQIQIAKTRNGQFKDPVELRNPQGNRFQVTNVTSKVVTENIKLLLNQRNALT